jgi:hypothetical protein
MSDQYEQLLSSHEHYRKFKSNWRYLLNSFLGGDIYRTAGYLTRYMYESEAEYNARLLATPLDNHCRSVIQLFNSFLFRESPQREFGTLQDLSSVEDFLEDADLEGRSLNAFMKDVSTYSSVFGHTYILLSKPQTNALTRAEELGQGVRPYVSLLTPLSVLDWQWERSSSGVYTLVYFKYLEESDTSRTGYVKEWTPELIKTSRLSHEKRMIEETIVEENQLGQIPVVLAYSQRSIIRGLGVSDIQDIAPQQQAIYNEYSEIEQAGRISNHPSLVKTPGTEAVGGVGAIVQMPDDMNPNLKPYLLEPSGNNIDSLYMSIGNRVGSIDKMASLGSVRSNETTMMSGVSRETDFQMLNAHLAAKADNLELAEENMWRYFALYEGQGWSGSIDYPDNFNIKDKANNLQMLIQSRAAVAEPKYQQMLEHEIMELNLGEDELEKYLADPNEYLASDSGENTQTAAPTSTEGEHPSLANSSQEDKLKHIQEMLMSGYANDEILALHPELTLQDIIDAGAAAAASN